MTPQFTWDRRKAAAHEVKHGVTFEEATSVFRDFMAFIFDDDRNSVNEYREVLIGYSVRYRLLIVSFTERDDMIRIISARKATSSEQTTYGRHQKQQR